MKIFLRPPRDLFVDKNDSFDIKSHYDAQTCEFTSAQRDLLVQLSLESRNWTIGMVLMPISSTDARWTTCVSQSTLREMD